MSLNNVVNNLIRAASSIPSDISDLDLDKHVAQLLANEAKAKEKSWNELGLGAYLSRGSDSPDPNAPKPNKRFLASIIRNVDGHNAAVIRAQHQAAREAREERRGESSRSGASRLFGGAMRGVERNARDRRDERRSDGSRRSGWDDDGRREYSPREERDRRGEDKYRSSRRGDGDGRDRRREGEESSRRKYDSEGEDRDARRSRRREEEEGHASRYAESRWEDREEEEEGRGRDDRHRHRDRRDRYRSRSRSSDRREHDGRGYSHYRKDSRSASPSRSRKDRAKETEDKDDKTSKTRLADPSKHSRRQKSSTPPPPPPPPPPADSPPPSPGPPPPPPRISRMDRYFKEDYDPRLDLGEVPKQGPVVEVGWDNMLAILKERGQKRRVRSPGLFDDEPVVPSRATIRDTSTGLDIDLRKYEKAERKKRKEERKKRRADSDEEEEERRRRKEAKAKEQEKVVLPGEEGLFDMAYVKKGGTREWDKGK